MGRFLTFVMILALLMASRAAAAEQFAASCGEDSLLVWPVSAFGDLPPSTLTGLSMNGATRAEFPMDRPVRVFSASVPDRAIAQLDDDSLQLVDLATGQATPLPIEKYKEQDILVGEPLGPDSTLVPVVSGQMNWIVDLATGEVFDFADRLPVNFFDPNGSYGPDVLVQFSPDEENVVLSTLDYAYVGPLRSPEPMTPLLEDLRGIEFSPDGSQLLLFIRDFQGDNDQWKVYDIASGAMSDVAIPPKLAAVGGWSFLNERTLIGSDGVDWYVLDPQTGETKHYQVDDPHLEVIERSNDGSRLLLGMWDGLEGYVPSAMLDLTSGESHSFDQEVSALYSLGSSGMRVGDRVILPTSAGIFVVDLAAASLQESAQVYGAEAIKGEVRIASDGAHAISIVQSNGTKRVISSIDLHSGGVLEIARTPTQPIVSVSPDGCMVAVGTFGASNDRRIAPIDVYSLEGALIHHFDNAVLIGWAPGQSAPQ